MRKLEKQQVVQSLHEAWAKSPAGVLVHYRGLSVAEMNELRRRMHEAKASFKVVKNTLAKRAAEGTGFAAIDKLFTGPTAIAYGDDPVAIAKILVDYAKEHEALQIQGGVLEGRAIDAKGVASLAALPPKEVLLAQLLAVMMGPISGFARVLAEVPASFVRVLAAVRDQKEAA